MENRKVVELTGAIRWYPPLISLGMNLQTNAKNLVCVTLRRKALWPSKAPKKGQGRKKSSVSPPFLDQLQRNFGYINISGHLEARKV